MADIDYGNSAYVDEIDYGNSTYVDEDSPVEESREPLSMNERRSRTRSASRATATEEDTPWYESLAKGAIQGATLGFADELAPIGSYIGGKLYDWTAEEGMETGTEFDYTRDRDRAREMYREAEEANPGAFLAGEIAPGLVGAVPGLAAKAVGMGARAGATASRALPRAVAEMGEPLGAALARVGASPTATGVAAGGMSGIGFSEGETAEDVASDAILGSLLGGAIPGAAGMVGKAAGGVVKGVAGKVDELADQYIPGLTGRESKQTRDLMERGLIFDDAVDQSTKTQAIKDIARTYGENFKGMFTNTGAREKSALPLGFAGFLLGDVTGVLSGLGVKTAFDAAPAVARLGQGPAKLSKNMVNIMEQKLASPIRESLRGSTPAVVDNVLSQTDPEYREAKRKEQEEDNE